MIIEHFAAALVNWKNWPAAVFPMNQQPVGLAHASVLRGRSRQKPRFLPAIDGVMSEKRPRAVFPID
jgi:hypothetical protein